MGTWKIEIEGHGTHHNGRLEDAEAMAAVFVGELRTLGHDVSKATFTLTNYDGTATGHQPDDLLSAAPEVTSEQSDA